MRVRGPSLALAVCFALAALLTFSALGCASPKRDECRALSSMINTTADRIDKAQASPLDPSGLKALAEVLEKSAGEADGLKLGVPDLAKQAKAYAALTRDVAKTARDMAAAGDANDLEKAKEASLAMEKLVGSEPKLVAEVNKLCTGE